MARGHRFLCFILSVATLQCYAHELKCLNKTFTQATAPQHLSEIHRSLTEDVNRERVGEEMKLEVEWKGDFKERRPGEYIIDAKLGGIPRCYRYIIEDVNECLAERTHEAGKDWYHQCHSSTLCENRNGTYECSCPMIPAIGRQASGMPSSRFNCEGKYSTEECCGDEKRDFLTHSECKREFKCYSQTLCDKKTTCAKKAVCTEFYNASGYSCTCPQGLVGNGRACTGSDTKYSVMRSASDPNSYTFLSQEDGSKETDVNRVCGCQKPLLKGMTKNSDCCNGQTPCNEEARSDGLGCQCKEDFTNVSSSSFKGWECVDQTPPMVRLIDENGEFVSKHLKQHVVNIKQCDSYIEYGYDVEDDNKDPAIRKFEMLGSVPPGCLHSLKSYNLTFKTWTGPDDSPWSSHQMTRVINVKDVDECKITSLTHPKCSKCWPQCSNDAKCNNELGTYSCQCPRCGQNGDGYNFISDYNMRPIGYVNGTGCVDSCSPKINLLGDMKKIFKVCKCDGPLCPSSSSSLLDDDDSSSSSSLGDKDYHLKYEKNLLSLLKNSPDIFCSGNNKNQGHLKMKFPCATAQDLTLDGKRLIDISQKIVVGDPVHIKDLLWRFSLDAEDEAGNRAPTVFKEIEIKEMTFEEIEKEAIANNKLTSSSVSSSSSSSSSSSRNDCPVFDSSKECNCNDNTQQTPLNCSGFDAYALPVMLFVLICLFLAVLCCICVLRDDSGSANAHDRSHKTFTTNTLSSSSATLTSPITSPSSSTFNTVPRRYPSSNQTDNAAFMTENERVMRQNSLSPNMNNNNIRSNGNTPIGSRGYDYGGRTSNNNTPLGSNTNTNNIGSGGIMGRSSNTPTSSNNPFGGNNDVGRGQLRSPPNSAGYR